MTPRCHPASRQSNDCFPVGEYTSHITVALSVVLNSQGRKPLNIPLKIVCEALRAHPNVYEAWLELGCSGGISIKTLKDAGLKVHGVKG